MPPPDLVIRGHRIVTPGSIWPASLHIRGGRIAAIETFDGLLPECPVVEAGDAVVMPGLVDAHVHVNEPGRTLWEGFETATRAAAAGGVTTIIDMPLNSIPPTTTLDGLHAKIEAATGKCQVDVGFWGGVVPGNTPALDPLFEAGVFGFKCFLIHSGVEEFPNVTEADLRPAMKELARLGSVLLVHAETPGPIERALAARSRSSQDDPRRYETFLKTRPPAAENEAIALVIRLSRELGTRVHIVHHCSAEALPALREARAVGVPITVETCPHYLSFAAEDVPAGATEYKCCPPVRERENGEQLWDALGEGLIDMVVSDHSPCSPELKRAETGDFIEAWGGIASLQLRLPVMWTQARRRGYTIDHLVEWTVAAPARFVGLEKRKGAIEVGRDADFVIWNPEKTFRVEPSLIHHRHKLTPYMGQVLSGVVESTFLRGRKIYDGAGNFPSAPVGELLRRGA